ncbi:MAG: hypothetical protein KGD57_05780, partial [Candidatus Lokiarchaeota archaeon]|nr:hypothetical protein [Candidatus Lokiarchaeota archaeon]
MLYHKKQIKNKIFACIVISLFLISSFSIFNFQEANIKNDDNNKVDGTNNLLTSSDFDNPFTGSGNDQEGRLYFENQSSSPDNHNGEFNIPAPKTYTYLDYGDMVFEFDEDYTANHTIEDDDALELPIEEFINFPCTESGSEMIVNIGSVTGTFSDDLYGYDNNTYMEI